MDGAGNAERMEVTREMAIETVYRCDQCKESFKQQKGYSIGIVPDKITIHEYVRAGEFHVCSVSCLLKAIQNSEMITGKSLCY